MTYRDPLEAAHARIAALEAELAELRAGAPPPPRAEVMRSDDAARLELERRLLEAEQARALQASRHEAELEKLRVEADAELQKAQLSASTASQLAEVQRTKDRRQAALELAKVQEENTRLRRMVRELRARLDDPVEPAEDRHALQVQIDTLEHEADLQRVAAERHLLRARGMVLPDVDSDPIAHAEMRAMRDVEEAKAARAARTAVERSERAEALRRRVAALGE